jgi:dihydroorotate dehydrogenase (fumarate)
LVLFNRFYQPDFDLDNLEVVHGLNLSSSAELNLPLRWISILYGKVPADLALTTGVHTATDVVKSMMAGAKVAMLASELLQNGYGRIPDILATLEAWMQEHEYQSIQQMQGSMSQQAVKEPAAFERANYMKVLDAYHDLP